MKKVIFIIVVMMMCVISNVNAGEPGVLTNAVDTLYQDGKAAVQTVYEDVKEGTQALFPDIKGAITQIANSIGVAAEHVYVVLVKKFVVEGAKEVFLCLSGIILLIFGGIWSGKIMNTGRPLTYRFIFPCILLFIGFMMVCLVDYDTMFMGMINPEYGAINYILDYSKSLLG